MTITASSLASVIAQIDGRLSVDESHTDNLGVVYFISKLVSPQTDLNSLLAADATALAAALKANEIRANINAASSDGSLAAISLKYSTVSDNATELRSAYSSMTRIQAVMTGDYLNTLSDAQLENIFSLTAAQVANLRTNKLQPAATTASAIRAAVGQ